MRLSVILSERPPCVILSEQDKKVKESLRRDNAPLHPQQADASARHKNRPVWHKVVCSSSCWQNLTWENTTPTLFGAAWSFSEEAISCQTGGFLCRGPSVPIAPLPSPHGVLRPQRAYAASAQDGMARLRAYEHARLRIRKCGCGGSRRGRGTHRPRRRSARQSGSPQRRAPARARDRARRPWATTRGCALAPARRGGGG